MQAIEKLIYVIARFLMENLEAVNMREKPYLDWLYNSFLEVIQQEKKNP